MLNQLKQWARERLGERPLDAPVRGASWRHAIGAALVALLLVEAVTGVAMMTVYSPGVHTAWSSTFYLQHVLPWGAAVRGMHHWASQALVVLVGLHLAAVVAAKAHRAPRERLQRREPGIERKQALVVAAGLEVAIELGIGVEERLVRQRALNQSRGAR